MWRFKRSKPEFRPERRTVQLGPAISGGGQGLHQHLPLAVPTKFDEATTDYVAVSA
jgi:hypothetical protein